MDSILIVEDDSAFADYLRRGLAYEGYNARVAASAEDGLTAWRALDPRVVILDIMLPGMDGLTACGVLRGSGYDGPVLMLTARDRIGDRVAGLDAGADDYLPKPFEFDELLARLRALLRRCAGLHANGVWATNDLELDETTLTARRAGRILLLSRVEFALLAALVRPPRGVRTRDELMITVWSYDYAGNDKVLDVTISRLRAKLGPPDPIRTLHGVGYRLVEKCP